MRTEGEALNTGLTRARCPHRGRGAVTWVAILASLVTALVLVLPASGALAAVTSIYYNSATVAGAAAATSISVTYTAANTGPDRLMLVGVAWNCGTGTDNETINTATYTPSGGSAAAMTLLYDYDLFPSSGTVTHRHNAVYYVVNPPSGAGQVDVAFNSSGSDGVDSGIVAGVAFFTGVNQSTPLGTYGTATGGSTSGSTVATVTLSGLNGDELVFDSLFRGGASAQTVGAGQTALWNTGVTNARGAASYEQATSSSVEMSWATTTGMWISIAVPIKPTPAGPTHDLTMAANPGGGGITSPTAGIHTYPEGTVVDISATPNVGYVFSSWTGDVSGSVNPTTVSMNANKSVTANFTAQNYDLTMAVSPSGGGTTTPAVGAHSYGVNTVVDITATPATGYVFDRWTGDVASTTSASTTVTVTAAKTVTALFTAIPPGTVIMEGTPSSGTAAPAATSATFSHTSGTGTNRLLLVGVSWNCGTTDRTISSITWNGTPLTEVKTQLGYNSGNPRYSAIYRLLAPASGVTGDVVVTFSGTVTNGAIAGAANFAGVDQTTPLGTPVGAGSATSDPTATVDATGLTGNELVFENVFMGSSNASTTFTPGGGQTQLWLVNGYASSSSFNSMGGASTKQATGSTVTMSWTTTTAARWAIAAVPIRPTADTGNPAVTINQAGGQNDPTNAGPIHFTALFSEPVTGFTTGDVTLTGPGSPVAAVTEIAPNDGTTYDVAVTGMTGSGAVTASVPAGVAVDGSSNPNQASTSSDNSVTFDNVAPTVTINQAGGQADPTNASPIQFTVVFSEAVTGFAANDVTLTGPGSPVAGISGSGPTYTVNVTGMSGSGATTATIAASRVTDAAGNNNTASTSADNSVAFDNVAPTVGVEQAVTQSDPTNAGTIHFTVVFSEVVTDFITGDVTLTAGTAPGTLVGTVTGSGATYDIAVSGMTGSGTVIASVAAGKAHDAAINANTVSSSTDNTVTYNAPYTLTLKVGWNLVAAAPGTAAFPNVLWGWTGSGYESTPNPVSWHGYFCQVDSGQTHEIQTVLGPHTIDLVDGWNLIGNSMSSTATLTLPAGAVAWVWDADTGYESKTALQPGQGAWVKGTAGEQVTLASSGGMRPYGGLSG